MEHIYLKLVQAVIIMNIDVKLLDVAHKLLEHILKIGFIYLKTVT